MGKVDIAVKTVNIPQSPTLGEAEIVISMAYRDWIRLERTNLWYALNEYFELINKEDIDPWLFENKE